jgi:hypothetical protein
MSDKITQAARLMAKWNNISEAEADGWSYELNTNFNYAELSAQIIQIMLSARMANEIPRETFFRTLKEAGKVPEDMTLDDFVGAIEADQHGGHGPDGEEA